jgi:transcriptional regulator with XRE-family HTH domain
MKTTQEYLNAAKKALGIESDYALAKWLGVTKQAASNWRTGKNIIDDYTAAKIADALNLDPLEVIAVANMERANEEERREYWRKIFRRCAAACVLFFLSIPAPYAEDWKTVQNEHVIHYA